jgi:hypothetical protein
VLNLQIYGLQEGVWQYLWKISYNHFEVVVLVAAVVVAHHHHHREYYYHQ